MFEAVVQRIRARRPLWAVFPTERLAIAVLAAGALWLVPGSIGHVAAIAATSILIGIVAVDYLRLPPSSRLVVVRDVPETLGLGDTGELTYTVRSGWPWASRVQLIRRTADRPVERRRSCDHRVERARGAGRGQTGDGRRPRCAGARRRRTASHDATWPRGKDHAAPIGCCVDHRGSLVDERASLPTAGDAASSERRGYSGAQAAWRGGVRSPVFATTCRAMIRECSTGKRRRGTRA